MSLRLLRVLTRIAFGWAAFWTLLWPMMSSVCTRTIEDTYVMTLRVDLWSLAASQEEYHAINGRYTASIRDLRASVKYDNGNSKYSSSSSVVTSIDQAGEHTWSARAVTPQAPRWTCTMRQGDEYPSCIKRMTWAERNIPRPTYGTTLIEFWLVWLTLMRRQRRAVIAMS